MCQLIRPPTLISVTDTAIDKTEQDQTSPGRQMGVASGTAAAWDNRIITMDTSPCRGQCVRHDRGRPDSAA
jgi:hypothetical protein